MSGPIHIWFHAAYSPPYKGGGWAWAKSIGGELTGGAGGERNLTYERLELSGLATALPGLPPGTPVVIHTANSRLAVLNRLLSGTAGDEAPEQDLDLWARITTAIGQRPLRVQVGTVAPNTALGFVSAWADLGRDKVKGGAFKAAIPKSNLTRAAALLTV